MIAAWYDDERIHYLRTTVYEIFLLKHYQTLVSHKLETTNSSGSCDSVPLHIGGPGSIREPQGSVSLHPA